MTGTLMLSVYTLVEVVKATNDMLHLLWPLLVQVSDSNLHIIQLASL